MCGYGTLNITLISSPSGSALTRASLRGTALELKKEQAYTHKQHDFILCTTLLSYVVLKIHLYNFVCIYCFLRIFDLIQNIFLKPLVVLTQLLRGHYHYYAFPKKVTIQTEKGIQIHVG